MLEAVMLRRALVAGAISSAVLVAVSCAQIIGLEPIGTGGSGPGGGMSASTSASGGGAMGGGIVTYAVDGTQYIAAVSGTPSSFWVDQYGGSPTIVVFKLQQ